MNIRLWNWRRLKNVFLAGLAVPAGLSLALLSQAVEAQPQPEKLPVAPSPQAGQGSLGDYRRLALQTQPALKAYSASAAAAEAKSDALDNMRLAAIVRWDLPTRRKQAEQGVAAAHAQLQKAEQDTLYAVTRTYLSVLYARGQVQIAETALDPKGATSLYYLKDTIQDIYKNRRRKDVKEWHVDNIDVLIQVTRGRREEAKQGIDRALAALREAIGLEADCPLAISPTAKLPSLNSAVTREQIVSLALTRRGEIVQADAGIEVTSLEIHAQKLILGRSGQTFGSGSDLHADPVPQGIANSEYRPGAISVEMPAQLVGSKAARVEQAEALQGRAASVADKTRHLITLQAEDAYYKWQEAVHQVVEFEKAVASAKKLADTIREKFTPTDETSASVNDLVDSRVRATQLQVLLNQARFNALLGLAALERVTAGGFMPGFEK
jgi:outer membrane protein TolC